MYVDIKEKALKSSVSPTSGTPSGCDASLFILGAVSIPSREGRQLTPSRWDNGTQSQYTLTPFDTLL